ncbi:hypothetical protein QYF36_023075 [Acer negundo]|nr:hypothetical protein QYF36_023075 [Acer negundo]
MIISLSLLKICPVVTLPIEYQPAGCFFLTYVTKTNRNFDCNSLWKFRENNTLLIQVHNISQQPNRA